MERLCRLRWTALLARKFHAAPSRDARAGCEHEAREAQRAQAYLTGTSSTVSERNEVGAALSRVAAGGV